MPAIISIIISIDTEANGGLDQFKRFWWNENRQQKRKTHESISRWNSRKFENFEIF